MDRVPVRSGEVVGGGIKRARLLGELHESVDRQEDTVPVHEVSTLLHLLHVAGPGNIARDVGVAGIGNVPGS